MSQNQFARVTAALDKMTKKRAAREEQEGTERQRIQGRPLSKSLVRPEKSRICLIPKLTKGVADNFEIEPALPAGLHFDTKTGTISGTLKREQVGFAYRECFAVFANNAVGTTSCGVYLEILAGSW